MTLLRLMLTSLVLLAQAWPAHAADAMREEAACETGCCTWLVDAGMAACVCTEESHPATPAGIPPAGSRELLPQVTWAAAAAALPKLQAKNMDAAAWQKHADGAAKRPGVRLAVLFCSYLN